MMHRISLFVLLHALTSCRSAVSGDGGNDSSLPEDGRVASPPANSFEEGVLVDVSWGRLSEGSSDGPILLLQTGNELWAVGNSERQLVFAGTVTEGALTTNQAGPLCATWLSDETVYLGCAPTFSVLATKSAPGSSRFHISVDDTTTTLWHQGPLHSSSRFVLEGGQLVEQEDYESSVSFYGDATTLRGPAQVPMGIGCLITSSSQVSIGGLFPAGPETFGRCSFDARSDLGTFLANNFTHAVVGYIDRSRRALRTLLLRVVGARSIASDSQSLIVARVQNGNLFATVVRNLQEEGEQALVAKSAMVLSTTGLDSARFARWTFSVTETT